MFHATLDFSRQGDAAARVFVSFTKTENIELSIDFKKGRIYIGLYF